MTAAAKKTPKKKAASKRPRAAAASKTAAGKSSDAAAAKSPKPAPKVPKKAPPSATKTSKPSASAKAKTATSAKPASAPTTASTSGAPSPKIAKPVVVEGPQPVVRGPVMRKKELIDTVVTRTGIKKKDAKPVIEGMLAVLGEAMAEGRELIMPPMGKVIVRKEKNLPNGKVLIVKVRQSTPPIPSAPAAAPGTSE